VNKTNELAGISDKLTNNFAGLVINLLGPDLSRGPPVVARPYKVRISYTAIR
jgi:hypothetical protein